MIGFLIFSLTAIFNSTRIKDKFDVIVASSPPVTTPVIGWVISKLRRSKLFIEIRDAQPESSEEFGNLRPSLFTRTIKKVIHAIYHRADGIITVTEGLHKFAVKSGVPEKRVTTVKSGVGNEFFDVGTNGIRKRFGWENDFLVLRAGTMGWAHSFEVMVEAARQLTDQPNIRFVFVGDGEKRTIVQEMVRDYGLKNITLVGSQPLETIPYFLRASNVLVECLRDVKKADPVTRGTFPAKLFEYMASGRPIIFGGNEGVEAVEELEKAGGALFFKSDDPKRLSELILALRDGKIDGDDLGRRYRDHADRFLRREIWADRYLNYLSSV
jgi:glycosyltransferase involved in cell wall biosynthesis